MKIKLLLPLLLFTVCSFSQSKQLADRFYREFNYKKSSELYTELYKKGNKSKELLSKLGNCFYFTSNTIEAEKWYKELILNYEEEIDTDYFFRYAQTLKSNGKYKEADEVMLKLRKLDPSDTRTSDLKIMPNYVSVFNNNTKENVYLNNVSTNTKYSDFGGFGIEDKFYFASAESTEKYGDKLYNWTKQPFLNLYEADITISNDSVIDLKNKKIFSKPITTKFHEASAVITKDGKTMYFTRDNYNGNEALKNSRKEVILKIYKATLVDDKWTNVEELPFNSDEYSTGHPVLSSDEKTMYFVSNRPEGMGKTDIYKVYINEGKFGKPVNLGTKINTKGREMFPFVDNNTLYFSSDGHLGLGGLDIFRSNIEGNNYSKPQNILAPFNSKSDDFSFWVDSKKNVGFFSSNREGGKGDDDIYGFKIIKKESNTVVKKCEQQIWGIVTDTKNNTVLSGVTVKIVDIKGKILDQTVTNEKGFYKFIKECEDTSYTILAEKTNFKLGDRKQLKINENTNNYQVNLALKELIVGNQIVINPIYFDYGKSVIRSDAAYELEDIVTIMKNNPEMVIKIESHADSRGKRSFNLLLSERRAKSTRDYIISRGISPNRIESAIGYGEERLLNHCDDANSSNCSEEEHSQNRSSYFYIVNKLGFNTKKNEENKNLNYDSFHIVTDGETLYRISMMYNISVDKLRKLNKLSNNNIFVGQKLRLQ